MRCNKHHWTGLFCTPPPENIDLRVEALFRSADLYVCLHCGKTGYLGGYGLKRSIRAVRARADYLLQGKDWAQRCQDLVFAQKLDGLRALVEAASDDED